jgi:hypothetical protein
VELLQVELQGKQKKYSSYRNTFFLLIFQLNFHQAYVLKQEKHGEGFSDFLFTEHLTLNRENSPPSSKTKFELQKFALWKKVRLIEEKT